MARAMNFMLAFRGFNLRVGDGDDGDGERDGRERNQYVLICPAGDISWSLRPGNRYIGKLTNKEKLLKLVGSGVNGIHRISDVS